MYTFLTVLVLVVCILLIFVVLVQNSKGGGLASGFAMPNQLMGVRRTNDFLEKTTWTLAIVLFVLALTINFVIPRGEGQKKESVIQEKIDETPQSFEDVPQNEEPAGQPGQQ